MCLQHHGTGQLLEAIQNRRKEVVLLLIRPAIAASDQVDLQRLQRQRAIQSAIELVEMLPRTVAEIGGVITASDDLQDQGLIEATPCIEESTRADGLKTGMVKVDLDAIKTGRSGTLEGLIQGSAPTPKCFEKKKFSRTQGRPDATNRDVENLAVSSVECQAATMNSVMNS